MLLSNIESNKNYGTSLIKECIVQMNQMHGLELLNFQKNTDLIIDKCLIEDNFCDGINVSSSDSP